MKEKSNNNNLVKNKKKHNKTKTIITPNPFRIEFEITNICNSNCEFCPRFNIKQYGLMSFKHYQKMLIKIKKIKKNLWINKQENDNYPTIVFGGYGEPLLHPQIGSFISFAKKLGFQTELITNGSTLTEKNIKLINENGLDQLSISLHTLNPKINKKINGLDDVIPKIKEALAYLDNKNVKIEIWRVAKLDGTNYINHDESLDYKKMLSFYKKNIPVLGPTPAWNRGGQFKSKFYPVVKDSKNIRCHILYFTLSISFDGDIVLCTCDFSTKSVKIAEHWNFDFKKIQKKIIILSKQKPRMCLDCRRQKINYLQS